MKFVGIDYSGAQTATSRLPGLRLCIAGEKGAPEELRNDGRNWTRQALAKKIADLLTNATEPHIVGIDHAFSFPIGYHEKHDLADYDAFLSHLTTRWPGLATGSVDDALAADRPTDEIALQYQPAGLRTCDCWTSSASSVYRLQGQGCVGKSSLAGIPWLHALRAELGDSAHFWPFDGWQPPENTHLICEIYPSLWKRRFPHPNPQANEHQRDAWCTASWMQEMHARGVLQDYFSPPLSDEERQAATLEGWILGVR